MFNLYDMFFAMGLAWAVYGIFNILLRQNRKDRDTVYAIAVILLFAIQISDHLIKPLPESLNITAPYLYISRNIYFLTGPVLYIYARSLLSRDRIFRKILLVHGIPFIVWVILSFFYSHQLFQFPVRMPGGIIPQPEHRESLLAVIRIQGTLILPILYSVKILYDINRHRAVVSDFYSERNIKNTLSWLYILVVTLILLSTAVLIYETVSLFSAEPRPERNPLQILTIYPVVFIFFFSYFSRIQEIPRDTRADFQAEKYKKSPLKPEAADRIFSGLEKLMKEERAYLNPDLTLDEVAERTGSSKHNLSQVISLKTDKNFYSYTNAFRIEAFRKAMEENAFPDYTLIAVAFECGFRSSSSFYSAFRKITGLTPREYLKS